MQDTEGVLRDQRTAILPHTTNGFRYPDRITGKQLIVFRRTQHANHAQFDDQLVHELLGPGLRQRTVLHVAFHIDIQERGDTADRHCRTILLLDRSQIAEVYPLDSFVCIFGRYTDIKAIGSSHLLQIAEGLDLLGNLTARTQLVLVHSATVEEFLVLFLLCNQEINTIEGDAAVITNDTAAAISIRQTGQKTQMACLAHLRRIKLKYCLIMRLNVFRKDF